MNHRAIAGYFMAFQGLLALQAMPARAAEVKAKPIQDNSFLVEEAYNQEPGVVQHISTFQRARHSKDWVFSFTQEWPLASQAHQFSYTLPVSRLGSSSDGKSGTGDVALNYRYQLVGDGDAALAISPRLTLLLPTGSWRQERGSGATGYQAAWPVSWAISERWAAHTNLGWTWTPRARAASGARADLKAWSFGQSLVWLPRPDVNLMLEWVYSSGQEVSGPGATTAARSNILSPGLRWSYDFPSGLQIVPGIALPIGIGSSRGERGVLLYLSFEHGF